MSTTNWESWVKLEDACRELLARRHGTVDDDLLLLVHERAWELLSKYQGEITRGTMRRVARWALSLVIERDSSYRVRRILGQIAHEKGTSSEIDLDSLD